METKDNTNDMVLFTFKVERGQLEEYKKFCKEEEITASAGIRRAIKRQMCSGCI